jgi:hypothetical protein
MNIKNDIMIDIKSICKKIEVKICENHHRFPKAIAKNQSIKLSTCCEKFQEQLEGYITQQIDEQIDSYVEEMSQNKKKSRLN